MPKSQAVHFIVRRTREMGRLARENLSVSPSIHPPFELIPKSGKATKQPLENWCHVGTFIFRKKYFILDEVTGQMQTL